MGSAKEEFGFAVRQGYAYVTWYYYWFLNYSMIVFHKLA
jgi:hypothetical protein